MESLERRDVFTVPSSPMTDLVPSPITFGDIAVRPCMSDSSQTQTRLCRALGRNERRNELLKRRLQWLAGNFPEALLGAESL